MKLINRFKRIEGTKYAILIRHSNREKIPDGIHDIVTPINKEGQQNALLLGDELNKHFKSLKIFSSPVERCLQTSKGIMAGFGKKNDILTSNHLGEHGPYVFEPKKATNHFINFTTKVVVEKQIEGVFLEGINNINKGSEILKNSIIKELDNVYSELLVFVSHDAIIAPFIYSYTGEKFGRNNWVDFLDGVFFTKKDNQITINRNNLQYEIH